MIRCCVIPSNIPGICVFPELLIVHPGTMDIGGGVTCCTDMKSSCRLNASTSLTKTSQQHDSEAVSNSYISLAKESHHCTQSNGIQDGKDMNHSISIFIRIYLSSFLNVFLLYLIKRNGYITVCTNVHRQDILVAWPTV